MGPPIALFWTSGDLSLWVSKPGWADLFLLGAGIHVTCSLRFTSGATPTELFGCSACHQSHSLPGTCKQALVGLETRICSAAASQFETRQTIYRLSYAGSADSIHGQWRIQDFPEEGAPTPRGGRQYTILPNFSKNCMKLKEFGPRGRRVPRAP